MTMVWHDFNIENELGNITVVKMKAVSAVVLCDICFHAICDQSPANWVMSSTTLIVSFMTQNFCLLAKNKNA